MIVYSNNYLTWNPNDIPKKRENKLIIINKLSPDISGPKTSQKGVKNNTPILPARKRKALLSDSNEANVRQTNMTHVLRKAIGMMLYHIIELRTTIIVLTLVLF